MHQTLQEDKKRSSETEDHEKQSLATLKRLKQVMKCYKKYRLSIMVCLFHSSSNNLYLILIDIRRIITIHNSICMVVYKYSLDIYILIVFRVMWRMLLPCSKLIGLLLFCLLFRLSILFFKPNIHTYKNFQGMSSLAL